MGKTLHLNLKRKWFDMILSGEKREEYREIKPYWVSRIIFGGTKALISEMTESLKNVTSAARWNFDNGYYYKKNLETITFSNGYSKTRRQFEIKLLGLGISEGNAEWGAKKGIEYFVLRLGNVIKSNCH